MARYQVTGQMHYRDGAKYRPGDEIELEEGQQPAPGWVLLDGPDGPPAAPQDGKGKGKGKGKLPTDNGAS